MDFTGNFSMNRRNRYRTVLGAIREISPLTGRYNRCSQLVTIEDEGGNTMLFLVTPETYVAEAATMYVGMQAHFAYNESAPAPLIYPPQYTAVAVVPLIISTNVDVGFFNDRLVNTENTLRLNIDESVAVVTGNNQVYYGSPAGHYLIVLYETSTRSIPAQTTPLKVVVMCEWR